MKTLTILIALTILTGQVSTLETPPRLLVLAVMGIAMIKLLLVAFQFMELKKAHIFWKGTILLYSLSFLTLITLIAH